MVIRMARSRRALVAGGLAALVALPVLGGSAGAVAPRTPAGPFQTIPWTIATLGTGPIKGIVTIESGAPGRVRYAFHGLPTTGQVRAVASSKPCSQPHVGSARILGWSFGASNPTSTAAIGPGGTAAGQFMVEISGVNAGYIRSLRIFRGSGSSAQRACAKATRWATEPSAAVVTLENTLVSNFLSKPGPRGLVTIGVVDTDTIRVRAELLHKDRGTFRLVGSTAPCSQAHTGSARVFSIAYNLGDTGTHEVGHLVDATRTLAKPIDALRSVRIQAKNEVAMETIECRGIIAILIGL